LLLALLLLSGHPASFTRAQNTNAEVSAAPAAELINGIDDITASGNCVEEAKKLCDGEAPGEGRLAKCISNEIAASEVAGSTEATSSVSEACREEVYQFYVQRNTNINKNVPLARACKTDAQKHCDVTWFFGYKAGNIISCLSEIKDKLSPACGKEIFEVLETQSADFYADPALAQACSADAGRLCPGMKSSGGQIQACLRENSLQLSWECEEQLFRQEMEDADDLRLSVRLRSRCMDEKRRFCKDVAPGASRAKQCLEEHRNDDGFGTPCKEELESMIARRVRDFRLDSRLRTSCEEDIYTMCSFSGEDLESVGSDNGNVVNCLQDLAHDIKSEKCKQQVLKYQELAAEDIRFNSRLADACYQDRQSFCSNVQPGSARVIRCMIRQREKLSVNCRAVMFDEEVIMSHNIDFQVPMKRACTNEIQMFCPNVPHGDARVIRCLQDNKYAKDFGKECKEEVREYETEAASDYRLNFRLDKACSADVEALCKTACNREEGQICGGKVLRCLTDHRAELKSESCKQEVLYFEKMEVTDFRNDVILAASCRTDVDKFCPNVDPGEGRIHECLRNHRKELSEACRKEELVLEEMEAENIELRPGILRACKDERPMFCKGVVPGGARMFRCLAEKVSDADFGEVCRKEVVGKLQRRQANWKLDPPLRKACKEHVFTYCDAEDKQGQEQGAVYKCLVRHYEDLDSKCQKEIGRAYHMAFFVWQPQAILTSDCDKDVQDHCLSVRPSMAATPGAVGTCVANILESMSRPPAPGTIDESEVTDPSAIIPGRRVRAQLSEACQAIVDVAEPPDVKQAFDASLSVLLLQNQLSGLEGATGMTLLARDRLGRARRVTLTGWTAVLGMAAMIVLVIYAAGYGYKRYLLGGLDRDYSLVVKQGTRPTSHRAR